MRPAAAAKLNGRAAALQRPRRCERAHLASITVTRAGAVSVNAKLTRDIHGRTRLRATRALVLSASAETLATGVAGAGAAGCGLAPVGPPPLTAALAPDGALAAPPALGGSSFRAPSEPVPGGWKAAIPLGVPTPLGPS